MKVVGLTGGIGSGKTTVASFFKEKNIPVYIADDAGKRLMNQSSDIRKKIIELFGEESYHENAANRKYIASKVFGDKDLLSRLNHIIHPAVAKDFEEWLKDQTSNYVIYEAAILFETGGDKKCDFSILVVAPQLLRIERLQKRDDSTVAEIKDRMNNQWSDKKKSSLADFIIKNEHLAQTKRQVEHIHDEILKAPKNC